MPALFSCFTIFSEAVSGSNANTSKSGYFNNNFLFFVGKYFPYE